MDTREIALELFLEAEKSGAYAASLVKGTLDKYAYEDSREKAFFKRLTEGTLERRITLDWVIDAYSKTPVRRMKPLIRNLLRLSVYQILYMDSVPDAAACSEAVRLAKRRGFAGLSGFVNGVLRAVVRGKEALPWPDQKKEPVRALSVKYSLPEWIIGLWREQYGAERAEQIAAGAVSQRPVTIRLSRRLSKEQQREALEAVRPCVQKLSPHPLYEGAWELAGCEGVASLPGFAEGLFYAQDVSSMLAVSAAGIAPGMTVMDLCAAPGGKTALAAELAAGAEGSGPGRVLAGDVSERKAALLRENLSRMNCENVSVSVWDASVFMEEYRECADVVLLDVPCSGLGVLGRKKDIRYRLRPEDIDGLTQLQRQMIDACWQYVKPGGVLLYSTCTMDRRENGEMVSYLLEHCPFEAESLDLFLPKSLHSEETAAGRCQLFCGQNDTDGFFMARLRRKNE
ncbi:MAG: 16S rRNA (cytosine(967)-C(5))-methyltransferase RsmB [Eubacteriales bacterium]|nr:16S rRNA (cytosine(967)-C(5))-methyltransferase RsmB [Eubacteriales bacterium]